MNSRDFALAYNSGIGAFELVALVALRLRCSACEAEKSVTAFKRPEDPVQYGFKVEGVVCPECGVGDLRVIQESDEEVRKVVREFLAQAIGFEPLPPIPRDLATVHLRDCEGPGCGASCGCPCHAYE